MAAKPATAVGSSQWIASEQENVMQLLEQEKEELIYPAQHETEWLNEHMAEIFRLNQFNVTDVFKTPGKLRGKTPRTTRKRNVDEVRVPLSDIFSSKPQVQSPAKQKLFKNGPTFAIAQDQDTIQPAIPFQKQQSKQPLPPVKSQADSGYHGSSQDEMEVDAPFHSSTQTSGVQIPVREPEEQGDLKNTDVLSQGRRTTEGSFHSAKEEQTVKLGTLLENPAKSSEAEIEATSPHIHVVQQEQGQNRLPEDDFDDIGSPSDESTPDKPMLRKKSSLTFASLPAREPLKTSIGTRVSRTSHLDQSRQQRPSRSGHIGRSTGGHQIEESGAEDSDEDGDTDMTEGSHIEILGKDESDDDSRATKLHNKSSTQRLHDKISMLGKVNPPRPSKSIPSATALAHLRQSEAASRIEKDAVQHEDDDSWIKPLKSAESNPRSMLTKSYTTDIMEGVVNDNTDNGESDEEFDVRAPELIAYEERLRTPVRISPAPGKAYSTFHKKSASTATLVSPAKAAMAAPPSPARTISVPNPQYPSTTPKGSPSRIMAPLSASKSKLQSIMKTAKGLFSSSASISAAAKMETLSPKALQVAAQNLPALYPNMQAMLENKPLPTSPPKESRKTRSSTEKEKEAKPNSKNIRAMQKMEDQLEKVREKETVKAAQYKQGQRHADSLAQPTRVSPRRQYEPATETEQDHEVSEMPPPGVPQQTSKLSRPTKPSRDIGPKARPQPVAIRVGTLSQRMPMTSSSLTSNLQDTLPAEPKRPGLTKKTSTASMSSNTGFKESTVAHPGKPRALLAAERKKEQDEREAQRKLEQKKEIERKRAAQQEEIKRQEQRHRAEAERKERERIATEQAKRLAQQQAIEKKRLENAKKAEQQRAERAAAEPPRPGSRLGSAQQMNRSLVNHNLPTNPAKPAKRPLEEDAGPSRSQAPRFGSASQQTDAKRRKTEDEDAILPAPRPTMSGAPVRQSHLGKKPSIFNHSAYAPAPPPPHMVASLQSHVQQFPQPPSSRLVHPNPMAQYANGAKIPFADAPNPPPHANKTPGSAYQSKSAIQMVKSSPQYQNGDAIHLPEIPTDSEDEDSDSEGNAFPIPDWATPGHLTDQLLRQEGLDGDAVFGPIAPLKMEEIFAKGNKERLKRMRERTSSANWAMSGDGLTLEEVRSDREMRERMRREGGWKYGIGN